MLQVSCANNVRGMGWEWDSRSDWKRDINLSKGMIALLISPELLWTNWKMFYDLLMRNGSDILLQKVQMMNFPICTRTSYLKYYYRRYKSDVHFQAGPSAKSLKLKLRYWHSWFLFITFEHISKILRFQKSSNSFEFRRKVKDRNLTVKVVYKFIFSNITLQK